MRKVVAGMVLVLALALAGPPAMAAGRTLGLVIGNANYRNAAPLENAGNDARDMAAALRGLDFTVVDVIDAGLPGLNKALADFAAKIQPGDNVVVFYAGHGVMGQASANSEAVDNYIVPIDAQFASQDKVPAESVGLSRILGLLEQARAGARIVIIDACRDNPFADEWTKMPGQAALGAGLVQPPSSILRNVYIAFATSPGHTASDNNSGKNGLFTQEVLKRINTPGLTINGLFEQVSASVEQLSKGAQVPWFAAGGGGAANLVLKPLANGAAAPKADTTGLDLRLFREAIACGLPVCLESAAADIRSPTLKEELTFQAMAQRARYGRAPSPAGGPLPAPPAFDGSKYPPAVAALVRANKGGRAGWVKIADGFMGGLDGFPKDETAAMTWYRAAGLAGSGEASFAVASAYHQGLAGVPLNQAEAFIWFTRADSQGFPPAAGLLGDYAAGGLGGQPKNLNVAANWYRKGAAKADPHSLRMLGEYALSGDGGVPRDWDTAFMYLRQAASEGDAEAMFRLYVQLPVARNAPGSAQSEAIQWLRKAAESGYLRAYDSLAWSYENGQGVPKSEAESLRWRMEAAERGSADAMYEIGMVYARGKLGIKRDCQQAGRWLRRAQTAGSRSATGELYGFSPACESYL